MSDRVEHIAISPDEGLDDEFLRERTSYSFVGESSAPTMHMRPAETLRKYSLLRDVLRLYNVRLGAGTVIPLRNNRLVGIRRGLSFALPFGKVEAGELPEEAAVRETLEETGMVVSIEDTEPFVDFSRISQSGKSEISTALSSFDRRKTVALAFRATVLCKFDNVGETLPIAVTKRQLRLNEDFGQYNARAIDFLAADQVAEVHTVNVCAEFTEAQRIEYKDAMIAALGGKNRAIDEITRLLLVDEKKLADLANSVRAAIGCKLLKMPVQIQYRVRAHESQGRSASVGMISKRTFSNGRVEHWQAGKLHRIDGPAVYNKVSVAGASEEYWLCGNLVKRVYSDGKEKYYKFTQLEAIRRRGIRNAFSMDLLTHSFFEEEFVTARG